MGNKWIDILPKCFCILKCSQDCLDSLQPWQLQRQADALTINSWTPRSLMLSDRQAKVPAATAFPFKERKHTAYMVVTNCVCLLQVYHPANGQMYRADRSWCKQITKERVSEPFLQFAGTSPTVFLCKLDHTAAYFSMRIRAFVFAYHLYVPAAGG